MRPETFSYLVNAATGVQVTSGAASARVVIPNASNGAVAKYVRVASKATVYVRPGDVTVNAAVTDILVNASEALILFVGGQTNIAYIQETAATIVNITPLEAG